MILNEQDLKYIVSKCVKSLLEVRYLNPVMGETSGYLERKFTEIITTTLKSSCQKIAEKNNILYFNVIPGEGVNQEEIKRLVKSYFFDRRITTKQKQDGSILVAIENYDTTEPLKNNQKIRVFHGTKLETAKKISVYGLSGKEQTSRVYSYEYWNNPTGLFVTISFSKAKYFATNFKDSVIIEFTANVSDLDAPVWNSENGSYFVAGQIAGGFSSKAERDDAKRRANRNALNYPHIENSDNPALANSLTNSFEFQALYFGDIEPNMIKRFWVQNENSEFIPYTLEEFKKMFGGESMHDKDYQWKLYSPTEDFTGEDDFVRRYNEKYGHIGGSEEFIQSFWKHISNNEKIPYSHMNALKQFMWPKQMIAFLTPGGYRDNVDSFYPEFN